ncbi:MAG: DUF3221 domain-containing protein [Bacillota bacterium]
MRSSLVYFVLIIAIFSVIVGCSLESEKGDYIFEKEIISNDIPTIMVVHNISGKEAKSKSLSDFLENDDLNDVTTYHVMDVDLYNDLTIGERVTVKASGYTMLSHPPQQVADEIIRHSIRK